MVNRQFLFVIWERKRSKLDKLSESCVYTMELCFSFGFGVFVLQLFLLVFHHYLFLFFIFIYLPYLSSIHEKANCIAILWTGSPHSLGSCLF